MHQKRDPHPKNGTALARSVTGVPETCVSNPSCRPNGLASKLVFLVLKPLPTARGGKTRRLVLFAIPEES